MSCGSWALTSSASPSLIRCRMESINARIASRTDKVDVWKTSEQKHRWVAVALLDLERRLHRIKGYEALPQLQRALAREVRRTRVAA